MNDILLKTTNEIKNCELKDISKQIMTICRAISPQFYKSMSIEDMKQERYAIELLLNDIDQATIAEMCKRAITDYPRSRSQNNYTYMDINYILTFFKASFDFIHSDSIHLHANAVKLSGSYNEITKIITEKWNDNGTIVEIKNFVNYNIDKNRQIFSKKDMERLFYNLDGEQL